MLHAEHLVLTHPISGKELDLRAPLPKDFQAMIKVLKKTAAATLEPAVASKPVRKRDEDKVEDRGLRR